MASDDQTEQLSRFISVTGCPENVAKQYLEATNWDMSVAVNTYFEAGRRSAAPHRPARTDSPQRHPQHVPGHGASKPEVEPIRNDVEHKLKIDDSKKRDASTKKPHGNKSIISRPVKTIDSLRSSDDDDDDYEPEEQRKYVGGSVRSGQQVLDPPRHRSQDPVAQVMNAARQHGAREVPASNDENPTGASNRRTEGAFEGRGHSLVDPKPNEQQQKSAAPVHAPPPVAKPREVPLRFYANGFTVDNGDLRQYEDSEEFLSYIKRSEIPPELRKLKTDGSEIQIRIENHQREEYVRQEPKFEAFTGSGHVVGLPTPMSSGSSKNPFVNPIPETLDVDRLQKLAERRLKTSQSATIIRLRLPEISTPLIINIDLERTLTDIRRFITENIPQLRSNAFEFLEPPTTKITAQEEKQKISETRFAHANLAVRRTGK